MNFGLRVCIVVGWAVGCLVLDLGSRRYGDEIAR